MTGKETECYDDSNAAAAWSSFYHRHQIEILIVSFSWRLESLEQAVLVTWCDVEK